jgi:hypothetical protein
MALAGTLGMLKRRTIHRSAPIGSGKVLKSSRPRDLAIDSPNRTSTIYLHFLLRLLLNISSRTERWTLDVSTNLLRLQGSSMPLASHPFDDDD